MPVPVLFVNAFLLSGAAAAYPTYQSKSYNQTLDHFDPTSSARWSHRYLYRDDEWGTGKHLANGCPGPILLYTGNEGPITAFWGSNGFMVEYLAPKWGAMLVFPEERFYGASLPFGTSSFLASNLKYLTTEQILEDYVEIVAHIKATVPKADNCPVIAFGGSYGGTLTTFLRAKYPATVIGGLAASAPIGYYDKEAWPSHDVDEFTWSDIATRDYAEAHPRCLAAITKAMTAIEKAPTKALISAFGVCDAAALGPTKPTELFAYALESMPQLDYPYPVGNLPAWPVNASCKLLVTAAAAVAEDEEESAGASLIAAAAKITAQVIGKPAGGGCLPALPEGPGEVPGDGPGDDSNWGWQSCTENLHQFSARGPIRSYTFDLQRSAIGPCQKIFNGSAILQPEELTRRYGGYKLGDGAGIGVNHLIWSNGLLDPWHGGGFLKPGNLIVGSMHICSASLPTHPNPFTPFFRYTQI